VVSRIKKAQLLLLLQVGSIQNICPPNSIHNSAQGCCCSCCQGWDVRLQLRPHSSSPHPQALLPLPPLPSAALQCPPRTDPPQPHLQQQQ
jgi:hypothetical protein